jgi:replicative DNA helicase
MSDRSRTRTTGAPRRDELGGVPASRGGDVVARVPPSNLQAEASLLGAMLLSRDAIADAIEIVSPEHFYKPAHAHIYDAVVSLYSAGEPADPITVGEELQRAGLLEAIGGPGLLVELQATTPAISSAAKYARIVHECAMLRRLIGVAHEIAEIGYSRPDDVIKAVDTAETLMYEVGQGRVSDTLAQIRDLLDLNLDRLEQLYERGDTITGTPSGYTDLDEMLSGLQPNALVVVGARPAMGKALALDTPIPVPGGWTTMGELRVGDTVFDENGMPCRVTYVSPVRHDRPCWKVTFDDGGGIVADAEHQWLTYDDRAWRAFRDSWSSDASPKGGRRATPAVRTTAELAASVRTGDGRANHRVPVTLPLELASAELPIDPYAFGVWLAAGCSHDDTVAALDAAVRDQLEDTGVIVLPAGEPSGRGRSRLVLAAADHEQAFETTRVLVRAGWCTRHAGRRSGIEPAIARERAEREGWLRPCVGRPCRFRDSSTVAVRSTGIAGALRELDVIDDPHIPVRYLRASVKQRLALLNGLTDVAAVVNHRGSVELRLRHRALIEQARELVCSLGHDPGPVRERRCATDRSWSFTWTPPEPVFRIEQRLIAQRIVDHPTAPGRWRRITDVAPVAPVAVRCITVDSPNSLYLAGPSMVPTHNTSFALGMAAHAAIEARRPVMIFSLEMSQLELSQRLLCAESRVDSKNVRDGKLSESDWKKISHGVGRLAEAPIWIDDNPNTTVMEIRAKARRLKSRVGDLGLIIIDYLQLMTGRNSAENRQVEVSEISRGLKILARELEVPVVALSQLSRGLESRQDKRPMLADLRESGSIEQDADVVMFIYRDEVYHPETSDLGTAEIVVAKHRNGPTGVVRLAFLPHYTRFASMPRGM